MYKKVHALLLDYDSCAAAMIADTSFEKFSQQGENVRVDIKNPLFIHLVELIRSTALGSKIVVVCFSNRQSVTTDINNIRKDPRTISVFSALHAISLALSHVTNREILFDTKVLADIPTKAMKTKTAMFDFAKQCYSSLTEDVITGIKVKQVNDNEYLEEHQKRLLLWMILSRLAELFPDDEIHAHVFDDKEEDILIPMMEFYKNNLAIFSRNIGLSTYKYCYSKESRSSLSQISPKVAGKGTRSQSYDHLSTYQNLFDYFKEKKTLTVLSEAYVGYMLAQLKTPCSKPTYGFFHSPKEQENFYTYFAKIEPEKARSLCQTQGNFMVTSVITKLGHGVHANAKSCLMENESTK